MYEEFSEKVKKQKRMSWYLLILLFFCYTFQPSLGNHEEKLPSAAAVVVGAVYCDTCSQNEFTKTSHFISGASVSMECSNGNLEPIFSKQVTTDEHGEFRFRLPFPVSKGVKEIEECSVKLISSNEPDCAVLSLAASSRIYLKANEQGKQVFSAGSLTFKPVKQPSLCNQNPSTLGTSNNINSRKISNPPTYKTSAIFPPIPFFTPPPLIPLPPIPGLTPPPAFPFPFPPIPGLTPPPPAFPFPLPPFPPIPGLTPSPPPPSLFPPIHFPPIPGFTPPSTPPPSFPFPLPPFPRPPPIQFPPIPGLTPPSPPPPSPPPPAFPFPLPPFPFPFPPPSPPPHSPSTKTNSP